jgi:hypothetical protein
MLVASIVFGILNTNAGARGGGATNLKVAGSMVSLEFFIDIILLAAL